MKLAILCIAFFGFSFFGFSQNKKIITIKTQINCDHCKQCESCGGRFDREIPFIKGIKDYSFDEKAMTLTLTYNTKQTTPEKLREAISTIGFDADDVKANPKAIAKLDDCCKKAE